MELLNSTRTSTAENSPFYTDHKPLVHLFSESRSVPVMGSARLQRWVLTLSACNYTIKYKYGKQQGNDDVLSKFALFSGKGHECLSLHSHRYFSYEEFVQAVYVVA